MKKLIVKISSVETSMGIMNYSLQLATDLNLPVEFIYSFNPEVYPLGIPGTSETTYQMMEQSFNESVEQVKKEMEQYIAEVKNKGITKIPINYKVIKAPLNALVEEIGKINGAESLVLENNSNTEDMLIGETNMEFIRNISLPIWVLPNNVMYKAFKHIVYATNYNKSDISTLKNLSAFAKKFNADITALHVTDNLDFEEKVKNMGFKNMLKEKTNYPINVQVLVEENNEDPSEMINSFAKSADADIIVMLKQNKSFFERVFKGSATKKLINKTDLPVLIYHS